MTEVLCNYEKCKNQSGRQTCAAVQIGVVDGQCVTRRKVRKADNYRQMMKSDVPPYHKESVNSAKIVGQFK